MADKRFAGLEGQRRTPRRSPPITRAPGGFDKLRVGRLGVYYRDGFKTRFLDYPSLERVFIRVQAVNGRMCCGTANFEYYRLVFVTAERRSPIT